MLDDGTILTGAGERRQRVRTRAFAEPCGDSRDDLSVPEDEDDGAVDFFEVFGIAKLHADRVAEKMDQVACDRAEDLFLFATLDGGLV